MADCRRMTPSSYGWKVHEASSDPEGTAEDRTFYNVLILTDSIHAHQRYTDPCRSFFAKFESSGRLVPVTYPQIPFAYLFEHDNARYFQVSISGLALCWGEAGRMIAAPKLAVLIREWLGLGSNFRFDFLYVLAGTNDVNWLCSHEGRQRAVNRTANPATPVDVRELLTNFDNYILDLHRWLKVRFDPIYGGAGYPRKRVLRDDLRQGLIGMSFDKGDPSHLLSALRYVVSITESGEPTRSCLGGFIFY